MAKKRNDFSEAKVKILRAAYDAIGPLTQDGDSYISESVRGLIRGYLAARKAAEGIREDGANLKFSCVDHIVATAFVARSDYLGGGGSIEEYNPKSAVGVTLLAFARFAIIVEKFNELEWYLDRNDDLGISVPTMDDGIKLMNDALDARESEA